MKINDVLLETGATYYLSKYNISICILKQHTYYIYIYMRAYAAALDTRAHAY